MWIMIIGYLKLECIRNDVKKVMPGTMIIRMPVPASACVTLQFQGRIMTAYNLVGHQCGS